MQISINSLEGQECTVALEDVGPVYRADDVIYFSGVPYVLSSAHLTPDAGDGEYCHCSLPDFTMNMFCMVCKKQRSPRA